MTFVTSKAAVLGLTVAIATVAFAAPASASTGTHRHSSHGSSHASHKSHHHKRVTKHHAKKANVASVAAVKAAPASPARPADAAANLEDQVTTLVNSQRAQNGCRPVRTDERLRAAARAFSADMIARGYFSHTGADGSTFTQRDARFGYGNAIGENIAWGFPSPTNVMTAWMNSPGHRANILNCKAVALGVGVGWKADGTAYWTQEFGSA